MDKQYEEIVINNQTFYLIGTAHVSKISSEKVDTLIEEINPNSICIELDQKRYESISNPKKWEDSNIIDIIKKKEVALLVVNIILSSFQKRVATKLESTSGQEMIIGINKSKEHNRELVLADRSVQITFMRIWRKLSLFEKLKLMSTIVLSVFEDEDISEEDLANLQNSDMLDSALNEVGKTFPIVKEVLVDERDTFLASKIRSAKGEKVVAILGAAHLPGVISKLTNPNDISEINTIPDKSLLSKLNGYIIPFIIVSAIIYTSFNNFDLGISQIKSWLLWNGSLSAIGVLIAGGHIFSIITAFLVAPFTSLNPLIAAGWFAGMVESIIKKPTVKDFSTLSDSLNSFKEFRSNKVMRVLMVVILANLFSSIATLISGYDILSILFTNI